MATGAVLFHTDSDRVRMRNEIREQIVAKLSNKEYRDTFVSEQINTGLAFQIRALREQKGWTQADLGQRAGMAQSRISVMEDANYARFNLTTLKRLASAFDVALVVRFEPFSKLVDYFGNLNAGSLTVASFEDDTFYRDEDNAPQPLPISNVITVNVFDQVGVETGLRSYVSAKVVDNEIWTLGEESAIPLSRFLPGNLQ